MDTIRGRLAVSYAVAMVATLGVFAATIYFVERPTSYRQIDDAMIARTDLLGEVLTRGAVINTDSLGVVSLSPEIYDLLSGVPGYVLVLGKVGDLFVSGAVPADTATESIVLDTARSSIVVSGLDTAAVTRFADAARALGRDGGIGSVNLGSEVGEVRFHVRPVSVAGEEITAVVAGVPTAGLVLRPQRLLLVILLVAPLGILASSALAYVLAGKTLQPVDSLVDEVEAISDGRSLHRRLAVPATKDELFRLATTLNAMLARLETSFLALRRFTADASHELKTPLTVLRSGIERAITHPKVNPEVMEVLEETLLEVKRMTELVDSLLTLARADEGRAPLHLERVELHEILAEVAETANILSEQSSVSISVVTPDRPVTLSIDRNRVRQLLMNLLTNAIKYTAAGGEVSVDAKRETGDVVIRVRDSGIGIAPGELPHVFDRFWRADPARSRSGQRSGSGLGLAICKWIAEAHGGSIHVQSKPGRGTTMTVVLPINGDDMHASESHLTH
jgi:two-component system OmpR family sensor kinase